MNSFTSQKITRSSSFRIPAAIEDVFPLFGPIREKDWAEGWNPDIIYSSTGLVDLHMIFRTKAGNTAEGFYTWVVSQYCPAEFFIEYTVFTQFRVWFVSVQCTAASEHTHVSVTYSYIGTSEGGNEMNQKAMEDIFSDDLCDWQEAINHFLVKKELSTLTYNP